ncbi:ABC transporter permease [Shewanella sp. D64]|uniref:ABC transporter permease n=1 Tax=unclassified Shewanella TaxID=196818 RepID=UPI0022BA3AB6|nr:MULTISPECIES: ABC transporter permease subunit [unclassified Shewanella]MEC4728028.1 ABC transporter permease [Shewanella sp. D64]MEC4740127.1 ABC transporter permease [Shewanella sp. E94]WBJ95189.1 ABC transporter permease [Shewanella sp. MTB7]
MSVIGQLNSPIFIIAAKEIKDSLRNRWVGFISLIFMVLSLSVTFASSAITGTLALPELNSLITSLSTIAVFIIPLAAILLSYDAFVGEDEAGTLLLLLSYPLTRFQIILGKLVGHGAVMLLSTSLAFGGTGVLLVLLSDGYGAIETMRVFLLFILSSFLLALVFILIGYMVSLCATEKARAVGTLLFVWFLFVLFYDLLLLAVLVADLSFMNQAVINLLIALNPTDLYRALNVMATGSGNGLALYSETFWALEGLYGSMLVWICFLIGVSNFLFKRKSI